MPKERSLVRNYIFNLIKTFSSLVFPLITFTYSARILGVDGVGQVNFSKSIVSYFTMLALLGMNYYGTREGAKVRDDRDKLSKFSQEMLIINASTTAVAYLLLIAAILTVSRLHSYERLLLIDSAAIFLQGLGMEWLYQAVEEYRYIAVRSMAFQALALVVMFIFVRDADDVAVYAVVSTLASSGSYVLNFINARKYINFTRYSHYEIRRHLRPLLWLFAMAVSIELYTVLDSTMLGFLQGDAAVGKYTAAIKANKLVNKLITAIGVVMIPRLSYYIGRGEHAKVQKLVTQAYNFVFMLSIPAAVGIFVLSDEITLLLSGRAFASAALTMRILTPIVVLIPFSFMTNQQAFIPMGKEGLILRSTVVGAAMNFACNMLLIPRYAENGAALGTVVAEGAVAIVCFLNVRKYFDMKTVFKKYFQYWSAVLPIPIIASLLQHVNMDFIVRIGLTMALSAGSYFGILFLFKNQYLLDAVNAVCAKIRGDRREI